ncbi:Phosphopantetheine adenylyltransferase [Yarrowia sp. C11]|nr:Phosphopantetheine adenylyltransferase [Yarrowia sp. E02]KAG5367640.1 Phosphopantetheine adenylyltransferase [Yarrowia sp. C11]
MLYAHTLMLVAPVDGAVQQVSQLYASVLRKALEMTYQNGTLDILMLVAPTTAYEAEKLLQQFYGLAVEEAAKLGRQSIDVRVLLEGENVKLDRQQSWEVLVAGKYESDLCSSFRDSFIHSATVSTLPVIILPQSTDPAVFDLSRKSQEPSYDSTGYDGSGYEMDYEKPGYKFDHEQSENEDTPGHVSNPVTLNKSEEQLAQATEEQFSVVALGGTFDHLHAGHKILLTLAAWLARDKLIVGITGPELLTKKKYAEAMESFDVRESHVTQFLNYIAPPLLLQPVMINDVYGPTASDPDIDALVLSAETRGGGTAINKVREEKGWSKLTVFEINIVGGKGSEEDNWADKLSSTQLRKEALER